MNKSTRIARATFDIVFLLLLLLPILTYALMHISDSFDVSAVPTFDAYVGDIYLNLLGDPAQVTSVGDVLYNVISRFDMSSNFAFVVPYFTYVVYVCIGWVFVNVLCFIPKLCVKLMKGWL